MLEIKGAIAKNTLSISSKKCLCSFLFAYVLFFYFLLIIFINLTSTITCKRKSDIKQHDFSMKMFDDIYINYKRYYNLIVLSFIIIVCSAIILDAESKNYGTLIFVIGIYYSWYLLTFNILLTYIFKARFWKLIWLSVFYIFLVTISLFLLDYFNFLYVPLLKSEAATSSRVMGIYFVCTSCVFFIGLGAKRIIEGIEENIISEKNAIGMQAAEIKALRLQINPHFLSNAHTKLNSLIRTDNIDKAIEYNTKIAALFRDTLASSTSEFTSLEAEFKWLQNYLEVEKDLFENLFDFSIETNNLPTSDFLFPSMLLQPLVENSIIHGFLPEWHKKVGFLKIELIEISSSIYQIIVRDDGVGFSLKKEVTPTHNSVSLQSINSRIALINQQNKVQLTLESFTSVYDNRGSEIRLTVIEKNTNSHI